MSLLKTKPGFSRRFISDSTTATHIEHKVEPSNRIITPANVLTPFRGIIAGAVATMLLTDRRWVTPVTIIMGATDMDGRLARWIDERWPDSGLGTSKLGELLDVVFDAGAISIVGGAILLAPHVSPRSKLGVGAILTQEAYKMQWALGANSDYKELTERKLGEAKTLYIEPTIDAKESMVRKFGAICCAVATHDLRDPISRAVFDAGTTGFAQAGIRQALNEHDNYYVPTFESMMEELSRMPDFKAAA